MKINYAKIRDAVQQEYNEYIEQDQNCELTDEELEANFFSETIMKLSDYIEDTSFAFTINNGKVEMLDE